MLIQERGFTQLCYLHTCYVTPDHQLLLKLWNHKLPKGRNSLFPVNVHAVSHTVSCIYQVFKKHRLSEWTNTSLTAHSSSGNCRIFFRPRDFKIINRTLRTKIRLQLLTCSHAVTYRRSLVIDISAAECDFWTVNCHIFHALHFWLFMAT